MAENDDDRQARWEAVEAERRQRRADQDKGPRPPQKPKEKK